MWISLYVSLCLICNFYFCPYNLIWILLYHPLLGISFSIPSFLVIELSTYDLFLKSLLGLWIRRFASFLKSFLLMFFLFYFLFYLAGISESLFYGLLVPWPNFSSVFGQLESSGESLGCLFLGTNFLHIYAHSASQPEHSHSDCHSCVPQQTSTSYRNS